MHSGYTLIKILLDSDDDNFDYTVDLTNPTDFTNRFVKINSEWYEICKIVLYKIMIMPKKSHSIIKMHNVLTSYLYYVDVNDTLTFFSEHNNSHTVLDSAVESILYYHYTNGNFIIIYKKNGCHYLSQI
jgi:hypothetical protein